MRAAPPRKRELRGCDQRSYALFQSLASRLVELLEPLEAGHIPKQPIVGVLLTRNLGAEFAVQSVAREFASLFEILISVEQLQVGEPVHVG